MCLKWNVSKTAGFEKNGFKEKLTPHVVAAGATSAEDWQRRRVAVTTSNSFPVLYYRNIKITFT